MEKSVAGSKKDVHPQHRTPREKVGYESLGFCFGEGMSIITSLGMVAVADELFPKLVDKASKSLANAVIEPNLEKFEWVMSKLCQLEECKVDPSKPRQERAESLARAVVLFSPAWVASMIVKTRARRWCNNQFGIGERDNPFKKWYDPRRWVYMNKSDRGIFYWDEGAHIGSLLLLNTVGHQVNDELIRASSNILQKTLGFSERKANDVARMAVIWELPNVIGMAAGMQAIYGKHMHGWWAERTAASPHSDAHHI
jgi:hypothetical protein